MEQILKSLLEFSPLAAIGSAIITGMFAYFGLIITKENKVSDFRQAWIDALRQDISKYRASTLRLSYALKRNPMTTDNPMQWAEFNRLIDSIFSDAGAARTSIELRVNPNDSNKKLRRLNKELLSTVASLSYALLQEQDMSKANELGEKLVNDATPILKQEWERVKSGERVYRWTRRIISIFLFIMLGFALYHTSRISGLTDVFKNKQEVSPTRQVPSESFF